MMISKKRLRAIVVAVVIICLGAAYAGLRIIHMVGDRRFPAFTGKTSVYVYPGTSADSLLRMLDGSLTNRSRFASCLEKELGADAPMPGYYSLPASSSRIYAARMFHHGWQSPVNLVLSGSIRSDSALAKKISSQLLMDSLEVVSALRNTELLSAYGFTPENIMSLFIPDTYQMYWTDSMTKVLDRQKEAYDSFWNAANLSKAEALGLNPLEVSILASIVQGETNYEPEMPSVAGVYIDRLRIGMPLQADPTIAYCFDYTINRVLKSHTQVDSPYNTYLHTGLPPGPICVPSKACLSAVLNPDLRGYLYFCASEKFDGTHRFAKTLSEHNANAAAYHRALTIRQRSK